MVKDYILLKVLNTWVLRESMHNHSWQNHVNDLSITLNRANAFHFKMRKFVANFDSYLSYCLGS